MSIHHTPSKAAQIETRVSLELKELIERAATYSGRTLSDFVITHVEVAARKVIEEHDRLQLDRVQSCMLVEALLSAKKPNKALLQAMDNYRKQVSRNFPRYKRRTNQLKCPK